MADGSISVAGHAAAAESPLAAPAKKPKRAKIARELSQTPFPYVDQDQAMSVARALLDAGGVALTRDQLAGAMKQTPGSGSFAWKIMAARLFGLIEQKDGKNQLTDLGFAIVDEARQKAARASSFLAVPLYKRIYDEFRGKQLPPRPVGLEQLLVRFGVAPKQRDKARLAFERAAKQAGFFEHGNERLVEPVVGSFAGGDRGGTGDKERVGKQPPAPEGFDPLLQGLLSRLPKPGDTWEHEKRLQWLQTLAANLYLIYPAQETDKIILVEGKSL